MTALIIVPFVVNAICLKMSQPELPQKSLFPAQAQFHPEGSIPMFKELAPLVRHRAVLFTVSHVEDDQFRVNVIPKIFRVDGPGNMDKSIGEYKANV